MVRAKSGTSLERVRRMRIGITLEESQQIIPEQWLGTLDKSIRKLLSREPEHARYKAR